MTPPAGLKMGDDVVVLPVLSDALDKPIWLNNPTESFRAPVAAALDWVERGDPIFGVNLRRSARVPPKPVYLRAPAAGLVLQPDPWVFHWQAPSLKRRFAMLLPAGAEVPTDAGAVYGDLCDFLDANVQRVFLELRELRDRYSEKMARKAIALLRGETLERKSLAKDFPDLRADLTARFPGMF